MKKILRKYPQSILVFLAVVFVALLAVYFTWGLGRTTEEIDRAINTANNGGESTMFNLDQAGRLDLRGLVKPSP